MALAILLIHEIFFANGLFVSEMITITLSETKLFTHSADEGKYCRIFASTLGGPLIIQDK